MKRPRLLVALLQQVKRQAPSWSIGFALQAAPRLEHKQSSTKATDSCLCVAFSKSPSPMRDLGVASTLPNNSKGTPTKTLTSSFS